MGKRGTAGLTGDRGASRWLAVMDPAVDGGKGIPLASKALELYESVSSSRSRFLYPPLLSPRAVAPNASNSVESIICELDLMNDVRSSRMGW